MEPDTLKLPGLRQHFEKRSENLGFQNITHGVDSFEIRIWSDAGLINPDNLVILRYKDSAWQLTNCSFWSTPLFDSNGRIKKEVVDSFSTYTSNVPAKLVSAIDSIRNFKLDTLPSQKEIRGFEDKTADGWTFTLEISTKNYYKILQYTNPQSYNDPIDKKMDSLLYFLANRLGFFFYPHNMKSGPVNSTYGG